MLRLYAGSPRSSGHRPRHVFLPVEPPDLAAKPTGERPGFRTNPLVVYKLQWLVLSSSGSSGSSYRSSGSRLTLSVVPVVRQWFVLNKVLSSRVDNGNPSSGSPVVSSVLWFRISQEVVNKG